MPEVIFTVQLPDGVKKECYSPSSCVHKYFTEDEEMTVADFLLRSRKALGEASDRVAAKYGYACTSAMGQLADIETFTRPLPQDGIVRIINI